MVNIGGGFSIFLYQQLSNIKVIYYFYEKLLNMSRIQDLKKIGDANINIIDLLSMFNLTGKSKYVETLFRIIKHTKTIIRRKDYEMELMVTYGLPKEKVQSFSDLHLLLITNIFGVLINPNEIRTFQKFCELNEKGLIGQNDLSEYKSFEQINIQLTLAELKEMEKDMLGCVIKLHDDGEWLVIKPLTFAASAKYGAFTKWCTTTRDNPEYFRRYSERGSLIYIINKKTGLKVASFKSLDGYETEFSFWNSIDSRIDSIESGLPREILELIVKENTENPVTNYSYLTPEQRYSEDKYYRELSVESRPMREDMIVGENMEAAIRNIPRAQLDMDEMLGVMGEEMEEIGEEMEDMGEDLYYLSNMTELPEYNENQSLSGRNLWGQ